MAEFDTTKFLAHHVDLGQKLSNVFEDDSESLSHYQIKGAKHGIRRFQNFDGTLTPEGRERYGIGPPREKKSSDESGLKNAASKVKEKVKEVHAKRKAKKRAKLGEYLRDHPKKMIKYKRELSEDEAEEIIRKIKFDRKLQDVKYEEIDRKSARFNKFVGRVGDFKNLYTYGTEIYNNTAQIYNALLSSGKISNEFITHRDEMTAKYGSDFYKKMTPDELSKFNALQVKYNQRKMPVFTKGGDNSGGNGGGKGKGKG